MIKTFPLRFTLEEHKRLQDAAYDRRESIQEFIKKAIEQRIQKEQE